MARWQYQQLAFGTEPLTLDKWIPCLSQPYFMKKAPIYVTPMEVNISTGSPNASIYGALMLTTDCFWGYK